MAEDREERDRTEKVAANWIIRLGGAPLTIDERRELDAWLAASSGNSAAFDHARSTWAQLDLLRADSGPLRAGTRLEAPPLPLPPATPPRRRWGQMSGLMASLLLMLGVTTFWFGNPVTMFQSDYRTAIGEVRTVALEDGSRVALGPDSAVAVHFSSKERRVELLSGVASFTAVPKEAAGGRPFIVEAANGEARALGTRFIVDRLPDAVRVTIAEHDVDVSARAEDGRTVHATLTPGRRVRYDAAGLGPVSEADADQAEAWRRGRLLFDAAPLSDVVAQLNRYRRGRIIIADAELAERRVSGLFDSSDVSGAVASIAAELGAATVSIGPFVTIIS